MDDLMRRVSGGASRPAMTQALGLASGRGNDLHWVFVTNGPAKVERGAQSYRAELVRRIWDDVSRLGIRVHVLGYDEPFQRQLARKTGGVFQQLGAPAVEESAFDEGLGRFDIRWTM